MSRCFTANMCSFASTNEHPVTRAVAAKRKGRLSCVGYMKQKVGERGVEGVRINQALCLDRCELGPNLVIYPEGTWYSFKTEADIDEIIETHLVADERVERLMLGVDQTELDD